MLTEIPFASAGLGLRREFINTLLTQVPSNIHFLEIAPENWLEVGGKLNKQLAALATEYPLVCHGLSLSLGSPAPLDIAFLKQIKTFLDKHHVTYYSEHLSYCSDAGHLYELLPIPFTDEAVHYVAQRVRQVQDILERRIALENISYYWAPGTELTEVEFINSVLAEADCDLLLDINNVYVNSINHAYSAKQFLNDLQVKQFTYFHLAGHLKQTEQLLIDTHGAAVTDEVWDLLAYAYQLWGAVPTVLERDFNFPDFQELLNEVARIKHLQQCINLQKERA